MKLRLLFFVIFAIICLSAVFSSAQQVALPIPQRLDIHSKILNEDRVIWVRTPSGYEQSKNVYPVIYQTDAPGHVNEIGNSIDFLVEHGRMPQVIVVGIANTDRTRDLTPSQVRPNGAVADDPYPTSGGADKFLDFIQTELMPEIEKRYRTAPYRIFAGHSFGGLLAIHTLITRPDLFNALIAVSPSLQWDDGRTFHQAQQFFASRAELKNILFFSLASEGNTPNPMGENFEQLRLTLAAHAPKNFRWASERYPDEDHGSTVLRAHYAGLRMLFSDWQMPRDQKTGMFVGGLAGVEQHYRELSARYGYPVLVPEATLNALGYGLMGTKKLPEAIAAFERNVQLYPASANVYDSLGEALENAGKFELASQNYQKAIDLGTKNNDESLSQFKQHLGRATAAAAKKTVSTSAGK